MKKRHLVDNFPDILPHLSSVVDRLRSTAEALTTLSAVLGLHDLESLCSAPPLLKAQRGGLKNLKVLTPEDSSVAESEGSAF